VEEAAALQLVARLQDGTLIRGQNEISHPGAVVQKDTTLGLGSPIQDICIHRDDIPVTVPANPTALDLLVNSTAIVYGAGSLFTSILACLAFQGVGEVIADKDTRKTLLLNSRPDRETAGMTATDYVQAIARCLNRVNQPTPIPTPLPPSRFVSEVIAVRGSGVLASGDEQRLADLGIQVQLER